jgi:hypothetical protein
MTKPYRLRGKRVVAIDEKRIALFARFVCVTLKMTRKMDMAQFMERLPYETNVHVEVEEDIKWIAPADAFYDPAESRIVLPESLYRKICKNDPYSMGIFFHELGHFLLGHRLLLHDSDTPPCEAEDAEWQADIFMTAVMRILQIPLLPVQMEFDF